MSNSTSANSNSANTVLPADATSTDDHTVENVSVDVAPGDLMVAEEHAVGSTASEIAEADTVVDHAVENLWLEITEADTVKESVVESLAPEITETPPATEMEAQEVQELAAVADVTEEETKKTGAVETRDISEEETKRLEAKVDVESVSETAVALDLPVSEQTTLSMYPLNQKPQKRFTRYWALSVVLLLLLLASIITPLVVMASYGVNAYATYNLLRAHAYGGVQHLLTVKSIFTGASSHPTSVLDISKLLRAQQEFEAAQDDFKQVQTLIDTTPLIHTITHYLPQYQPQVASARAASQVGIDTTLIGEQLISAALVLAPRFHNPLLSDAHTPLITANDLDLVGRTIDAIMPSLNDIQVQSRTISLSTLPISSSQRTQIQQLFQLLPQVQMLLQRGRDLLGPVNWLLGVGQPRTFLVQTMDRAELRPTGGFTGQYGELSVNSGRVAPFSLHDISNVEYSDNSPTSGHVAPEAYRSWWPFANWGLRDSNLSADFPTSARIAINLYKAEVGHNVDGVIMFTPFFIEHILQAIGPIQVPRYKETITAQNLEDRLHYYQLDNAGIRKIEIIEHVNNPDQARKLFTSEVARIMMDRVRHASPEELMALGLQVLSDLRTRDLQVYMTNAQVESLLEQYGYAGEIDRSNVHDGLYIVQANVSASKASQYVQTLLQDTVKLDSSGGATHTLIMHLVYNQIGPVYGLDTYRDYVRVYVPESARLLSGDGFDTGLPLCGGPLPACPSDGVYPRQQLVCPTGQYDAGAAAPMLGDPYQGGWHPIDKIGPPTNTQSDELGRAMFGGYVVVPKNCSMTVTLSWYIPPLSNGGYDLLIQRQASTFPILDLTVIPAVGNCDQSGSSDLHFNGILTEDSSFVLKSTPNPHYNITTCTLLQEAVTTSQQ